VFEIKAVQLTASERVENMDDRRKTERAPVEQGSNTERMTKRAVFGVTNLETDRLIGQMTDISRVGLQLATTRPVQVRTYFNLRLRLPETIQSSMFIIMEAECIWCKQGSDERTYTAGFKLNSITPSNIKRIHALLVRLGKIEDPVVG
jgi:hypothetical protein